MPVSTRQWFQWPFQGSCPGTMAAGCVPLPKLPFQLSFVRCQTPQVVIAKPIGNKHSYLSWERASSQLEGRTADKLYVFCIRIIIRTPHFDKLQMCAALLHQRPTPPTNPASFSLNPRFTVVAWPPPSPALEMYRRPRDLCIRQHPLGQPRLTAVCEAKLNQMCLCRLIFTAPSHSASISMPCRAFKSRHCYSLLRLGAPKRTT